MNSYNNEIVFDYKLGYIPRKTAQKKAISRISNQTSFCLLCYLIISTILSFLISIISQIFLLSGINILGDENFVNSTNSLLFLVGFVGPFLVYVYIKKENIFESLRVEKLKLNSIVYILAGVGLGFLANIPVNFFASLFNNTDVNFEAPSYAVPTTTLGYILTFFSTAIIPAIFEEFVLRGIILGKLRKYGDAFAIVFSALIFACLHINLVSVLVTFCSGCVMGFVYVKTKNIWVPVIIHFLNNALSVTFLFLSQISDSWVLILDLVLFYGFILFGIIAFGVLIIRDRNLFKLNNRYMNLSGGAKFSSALLNPSTIVLLSYCLLSSVFMLFAL